METKRLSHLFSCVINRYLFDSNFIKIRYVQKVDEMLENTLRIYSTSKASIDLLIEFRSSQFAISILKTPTRRKNTYV